MEKIIIGLCALVSYALASCGKQNVQPSKLDDFIVGGDQAVPYSWPWQVPITITADDGKSYLCGGTLISEQWILTAGHCCDIQNDPSKYLVKLGVFNRSSNNELGELIVGVIEVHINPLYNTTDDGAAVNDIGLLKLSTAIEFSDHISPICLPYQNQELPPVGTNLVVTGWGATSEEGSAAQSLNQVLVPIVNDTYCQIQYGSADFDNGTMFCAGLQNGGKDSCQGDSGGPAIYYDSTAKCYIQFGVVSYGNGCARANYPGVYTNVPMYMDWISSYVSSLPNNNLASKLQYFSCFWVLLITFLVCCNSQA